MTFGSLFSGIGGMDLGLERAGMECKWQVEIDPFCQKVLAKHWPGVKRYGDIRTVTDLEPVDLIAGGFPCQDISDAGRKAGIGGARSGLWSEFSRIIGELRPRFVLVENVAALLGRGMAKVLGDLSSLGYDAEWDVISAAAVGADHLRERVWIIAYPNSAGVQPIYERWRQQCAKEVGSDAANNNCPRLPGWLQAEQDGQDEGIIKAWLGSSLDTATPFPGLNGAGSPVLGRGEDGIPNRVDRMHAIGNAVVPQIPELIGRRIMEVA